jgi:tetratricopeptide (TPR) repeat protein
MHTAMAEMVVVPTAEVAAAAAAEADTPYAVAVNRERRTTTTATRHRPRWPWGLAGIVLVLAGLFVAVSRGPLGERLWPEAEAETLRRQADAALASGHLTAVDGSGARELYEAAMAIDPDRAESRAGLSRVADAALHRAERALAQGDLDEAERSLALARSLSAPRAGTDALGERLRRRELAIAGIDAMLREAERARDEGRFDGDPRAALPLYRRILELQPGHLRALEGREDALSTLLAQAGEALRREDMVKATARIATARDYDPGHGDLPEVQEQRVRVAETLRRRGDRALRDGRTDRAAEAYRRWREADVDTEAANRALAEVAALHLTRMRAAIAAGRIDQARTAFASAAELPADPVALREARLQLRRAERSPAIASTLSPTQRARRLRALLDDAQRAEAAGDWLTPPGESAFDKLRAARALAPDDPAVRTASSRLQRHARACFANELRDNRLQRARVCLDAWTALDGDRRAIAQARSDLARRWIAVGEERLGRGELPAARAAHDMARTLDASVEGLDDFDARLRAAEAVVR